MTTTDGNGKIWICGGMQLWKIWNLHPYFSQSHFFIAPSPCRHHKVCRGMLNICIVHALHSATKLHSIREYAYASKGGRPTHVLFARAQRVLQCIMRTLIRVRDWMRTVSSLCRVIRVAKCCTVLHRDFSCVCKYALSLYPSLTLRRHILFRIEALDTWVLGHRKSSLRASEPTTDWNYYYTY